MKAGVFMLIILYQVCICLLVVAVGMVLYGVGRLLYVLMLSLSWTSSPIRQISRVTDVNKGIVEKTRKAV